MPGLEAVVPHSAEVFGSESRRTLVTPAAVIPLPKSSGTGLVTRKTPGASDSGRGLAKFGPRRLIAPALTSRELPPLDVLLLSHAHMDHTDLGTLSRLPRTVPVVVQPGNGDLVRRFRHVHM